MYPCRKTARARAKQRLYQSAYIYRRRQTDITFRLQQALLWRMRDALRDAPAGSKKQAMETLLGCNLAFLAGYLHQRFTGGMTWQNWSRDGWLIRSITPPRKFDLKHAQEQRLCFNYKNLQPRWSGRTRQPPGKPKATAPKHTRCAP